MVGLLYSVAVIRGDEQVLTARPRFVRNGKKSAGGKRYARLFVRGGSGGGKAVYRFWKPTLPAVALRPFLTASK